MILLISINAWMDKDGKEYKILYNQKTQDTAQAFSFLKNTSLQRGCYPVVGMEVDFTNKFFEIEHFLFVGFELLFRFEEFGQDYNGLSVSVDSLIEFSQNVSTTFPGCKFFFQDCRFPTGRYTNRHQLVCMLPWDIREEIRDVSEFVAFAFKKEFPFWNWRKGEAIERIIVKNKSPSCNTGNSLPDYVKNTGTCMSAALLDFSSPEPCVAAFSQGKHCSRKGVLYKHF